MGLSFNSEPDFLGEYITVRSAAEMSGYNQQYLRRLLRNNILSSKRFGQLCGPDPIPKPIQCCGRYPLRDFIPGNSDVLLVAALAYEPPVMGRVYRTVYNCHGFEYPISLILFWDDSSRPVQYPPLSIKQL